MKNYILILLILISFFGYCQLEPVGNIVFTDVQKTALQNAFANPSTSFPDNTTGYSDDIADINTRAEEFRSDMAGSGIDRGAFDNFNVGKTLLPRYSGDGGDTDTQDPFPPAWTTRGYGPAGSNRNIHSAALKAYATDDATLALYVGQALLQRANDVHLDFSNGGSRRVSGEPTKTNSTYGTVERFPFERQENFRCAVGQNPYFMLSSKMEQYAISYSIVYDLIKNTSWYTTNGQTINYWFNDYYRFIKFSADRHTNYWLGSNWRNFQQDWARPTNVYNGGSSQRVAYSALNTPLYLTSDGAAQGINNRNADGYSYVHFFGELFDIDEGKNFGYDIFRAMLAIAVFPDGTFHEHYRWDANPDYVYTHIIKYFFMAHTNEVAVERGFLPLSDDDKFYGYSSSIGTNELYNGATFTSTSGGPKNLRLILDNLSKYYRLPVNGGFEGQRYRENGSPYSTSHVQNMPQAIFLSRYPNDTAIDDYKNYRSSAGYTSGLNANMQANGDGPHSLGTAWGFGNAIGGHIAFGTFDAFNSVSTNIRYVNTTGGGNGTSDANAWSLATALTSATSDMTIYVKKGVYNISTGVTSNITGTLGNPIRFIGYDTVPGDLDNLDINTQSHSNLINGSVIPIMQGTDPTTGFGITWNGDYIHLINFGIRNYFVGTTWNPDNGYLKNVFINYNGVQDGSGFTSGEALRMVGNNNLIEDFLGLNNGSISLNVTGGNNTIRRAKIVGNNENRPVGYYLLFSGSNATGNIAENCSIERYTSDSGGNHQGHGYIAKNGATNNIFRNSVAYNTGIEASYKNSTNNTWENITITSDDNRYNTTYSAGIRIMNGSNNNLFKNISIKNNLSAIEFRDYDDGTSSDPLIDADEGGSDNDFINIVADRTTYGIWFSDGQGAANSSFSNDNTFINCTFDNTGSTNFIQISQNVQNLDFVNCIVNGVTGGLQATNGGTVSGITYSHCNFTNNGFSAPSGTNITTIPPPFTDAANDDYALTSSVLDIGTDPSAIDARASTDFIGLARTAPYTLGAFEFGATPPPTSPNAARRRAFYNNFFNN